MSMPEHSILAPSSAAIRMECSGSRALEAMNPETEPSQASLEGTAAHWAAAEMLAGRVVDVGLIAPNGVMLTEEMLDGADMYVSDIAATMTEFAGCAPYIEQPITIQTIHAESWGTPDFWVYKPYKLVITDYKFGHRYVEVFENWQMIDYVAGILDFVGVNGLADQQTEVVFRIVQPRCYVGGNPIREWRIMASDLRPYFNRLRNSEARAMQPDAMTTVNPHCIDCRGRPICRAAQVAAYNAMDVAASSVPFNLEPAALGAELRYVDRAIMQLEARRTGLAEQALAVIKQGKPVPFYKAEPTLGRERWAKPEPEIMALGAMMNIDLSKPKLITPKQAIKAGLDESVVKAFSEVPYGETKLQADDGSAARKIFSVNS